MSYFKMKTDPTRHNQEHPLHKEAAQPQFANGESTSLLCQSVGEGSSIRTPHCALSVLTAGVSLR